MTTTVVAGPSPSGLNTCTETRYCVKICSRWMVYFSVVWSLMRISFSSAPSASRGLNQDVEDGEVRWFQDLVYYDFFSQKIIQESL